MWAPASMPQGADAGQRGRVSHSVPVVLGLSGFLLRERGMTAAGVAPISLGPSASPDNAAGSGGSGTEGVGLQPLALAGLEEM